MKKALFLSVLVSGLFFSTSASAQVVSEPGTLIKTPTTTAVYYLGEDGKRHAFPNSHVYFSWYDDFSTVKTISDFELSQIPLGKNVLYRSGSRLIKTPSVNEVYAVGPWGELRNIATEEVAIALYGEDWAKLVDDIDISFFFDYHIVGVIDIDGENIIYPRGSLIHNDGLTWVIDTRSGGEQVARPISGQAWVDNRFEDLLVYKYTGFVTDQYDVGIPVYGKEVRFTCVYCERSEYDNRTVFETNFINVAVGPFKVSGSLPENWNITNTTDNVLELETSDGSLVASIDILDSFNTQNFDEYFDGQDDALPVVYKGKALDNQEHHHMMYRSVFDETIQLYTEFKVSDDHLAIFAISPKDLNGQNKGLEKNWDEIELFLTNISTERLAS